jgi:hypothetical protein
MAQEVVNRGEKTCAAMSESPGGSVALKFVRALPWRAWARPSICSAKKLRNQPCSITCRAYQSRSAAASSVMLWYQVICASASRTIAGSRHAAAKARMYFSYVAADSPARPSGNRASDV